MPEWVWVLVVIPLATLRLTRIVVMPERIAEPLHNWTERQLNGKLVPPARYLWLSYLIQCHYCMSVWMGAACTLIWLIYPYALLPLVASIFTIKLWDKL